MFFFDCFIFDFDGTLADSRLNIANSFNHALRANGLKEISPKLIYPLIGKLNIEETFKKFYSRLSQEKIKKLTKDFRKYQIENVAEEVVFYDNVFETIKKLHKKRKKLVILTTKHIDQIQYILRIFKLNDYFDVVFGSGLIQFKKPEKECFEYISNRFGRFIPKNKYVMVGDSSVDCKFANNSQIEMIGVSWGVDSSSVLKKAGAKHIINHISELLKFT